MFHSEYLKTCPSCGEEYEANRTNQVYCTKVCKSRYHNGFARLERNKSEIRKAVTGKLDSILWKNREILKKYKGTEQLISDLEEEGFSQNYITYFDLDEKERNRLSVYDQRYILSLIHI